MDMNEQHLPVSNTFPVQKMIELQISLHMD